MTEKELKTLIDIIKGPAFDHCSKTYWRGVYIHIAFKHRTSTINMESEYNWAYQVIQSYRK